MIKLYTTIIIGLIALWNAAAYPQKSTLKIGDDLYPLNAIKNITLSSNNTMLVSFKNGAQHFFSPCLTCYFIDSPSSIDKVMSSDSFEVFPNPVSDLLYINSNNPIGLISIYDINGKLIISQESDEMQTSIDLSMLRKGIYFVRTNQQAVKILKK